MGANASGDGPGYGMRIEPDGDECCELVLRKTTAQEREDFGADRDWSYLDL